MCNVVSWKKAKLVEMCQKLLVQKVALGSEDVSTFVCLIEEHKMSLNLFLLMALGSNKIGFYIVACQHSGMHIGDCWHGNIG